MDDRPPSGEFSAPRTPSAVSQGRTVVRDCRTCPHRHRVEEREGYEWAECSLLPRIAGNALANGRSGVRVDACEYCSQWPVPTPRAINPMIGSLLFNITQDARKDGLDPEVDETAVAELEAYAIEHIEVVEVNKVTPAKTAPYRGPCVHLGEEKGTRPCLSCRGNVHVKIFECRHDLHLDTSLRKCQTCPDYDPSPEVGSVSRWAVGLTTSPRETSTIQETLSSLRASGWDSLMIFAEPGSTLPPDVPADQVVWRTRQMGAWGNFYLGLSELYFSDPHADAYFMSQDDAVFPKGLKDYLEESLWPHPDTGVVSLHTPSHHAESDVVGFFSRDIGWDAWGAMGFVFSNNSARALLRDGRVLNHRQRGIGNGMHNVDSVVGDWCKRRRLRYFLHAPSLCQHTGETSTLWKHASLAGQRVASDFAGIDEDIREVMADLRATGSDFHTDIHIESAPLTPISLPRQSGIAAMVFASPDSGFHCPAVTSFDAQELPADEHFVLSAQPPDDLENGWKLASTADCGVGVAATQASSGEWFAFLSASEEVGPMFVSSLNAKLREAPSDLGLIALQSTPEGATEDGELRSIPVGPFNPSSQVFVVRRPAAKFVHWSASAEWTDNVRAIIDSFTSKGWKTASLQLRALEPLSPLQ